MKLIYALSIIIILHLNVLAQDISSAELSAQFNYAKELFESEKYFEAITEFKRLIFFDREKRFSYQANLFIAKCYARGGWYTNADEYFNSASTFYKSSRDLYEIKLEKLKMFLISRNETKTLDLISEITARKDFSDFINESLYWSGVAHIFFNRAETAKIYFDQIDSNDVEFYDYSQLLSRICDTISVNQKSLLTAKILSYAFPGAGQFYMGEYFSGVISFAWNALSLYLAIDAFSSHRNFDGAVILGLLWYRFYAGNIENTENFAKDFNTKVLNNWLNYLQHEYKGPKP